jgi:anaerobic magnesium-protoporphyrin IX monomethyl ester cyclase
VRALDHEMPGVAWDLLPMERYRAHNWHCFGRLERQPYAALYTSLGCPFKCSFCCIQAPFKEGERVAGYKESVNTYRCWSPQAVADSIAVLVERHGVRNLKIADEMFVLNAAHVAGICDAIIARGWDLNIWAYARVDTIRDDRLLDKMRRAGVSWLAFGIESASERVRDGVDKGFNQEDIFRTLDRVRAAGMHVIGNYIFGLPDDDLASMQATLDLAVELNCEFANFYCAMAYPGSQLYGLALAEGWALPADWSGYSQHAPSTLPLPTRHLPASEVLRFRDRAFLTYFGADRYLDMVARRFNPATARHVREMAAVPLVRHHV